MQVEDHAATQTPSPRAHAPAMRCLSTICASQNLLHRMILPTCRMANRVYNPCRFAAQKENLGEYAVAPFLCNSVQLGGLRRGTLHDLARTVQPLSALLPRFDVVSRGRPTRGTGAVPAQILDRLRRTLVHLLPRHSAVPLERHPMAHRSAKRIFDRLPSMACGAIDLTAANRGALFGSHRGAQCLLWLGLVRQHHHAGHSGSSVVSVRLSAGVCARKPLARRASDLDADRLVGGGIPRDALDVGKWLLFTLFGTIGVSAIHAAVVGRHRRSRDDRSDRSSRPRSAAHIPVWRAFVERQATAVSYGPGH